MSQVTFISEFRAPRSISYGWEKSTDGTLKMMVYFEGGYAGHPKTSLRVLNLVLTKNPNETTCEDWINVSMRKGGRFAEEETSVEQALSNDVSIDENFKKDLIDDVKEALRNFWNDNRTKI
ncbi:uncharacterized protein I206_106750 [Kwoniella pini CBS 10737]|uniref:Uncharacterized protein n=1 Tax=Kwoniella pini CBS 10737 TaxID=1296096 RepID=A0A1B9HTC4_9TREE|nr:uncharacterized protein I206_07362 [Kwoniella pini CBS 10737]OCF46509.1 hypothetical protein I206_07362 [Kwoniella pini CBS 10737]